MDGQLPLFKAESDNRSELLDRWFNRQWMFCHFYAAPIAHIQIMADELGILCETVMDFDYKHFCKRAGAGV